MRSALPRPAGRVATGLVLGAASALLAAAVAAAAAPQPPGEPPGTGDAGTVAAPAAGGEPGLYLGVGSCLGSGCHASSQPIAGGEVLGNEYFTWLQRDPHQGAFTVLYNEESRRIAGNLDLGDAWKEGVCLDCHALAVAPEKVVAGGLELADGISCEACHGPASGWRDAHTEPGWERQQSLARGLVDLRSVPTRAGVCLDCHLGDADRQVDHALLAAGHPVLVFELDNYSERMPPHWRDNPSHGLTAWAVGQAAAFRAGAEQLARRARSPRWPEFSEMTCDACHHDLAGGEWRQERGYAGRVRPGQPPWSPARWAVLRHLVGRVAPEAQSAMAADVAALATAVERMNQPAEAAAAAGRLAAALGPVERRLGGLAWNAAESRRFLAALGGDSATLAGADFDTARQLFFAVNTVASHLTRAEPRLARGELPGRLAALEETVARRGGFDRGAFAAALGEVVAAAGG